MENLLKGKMKEYNEEQNSLRKKRDEYCQKMMECQKKIDDIEKQKYDVNSYLGKVLFISINTMKYSTHVYLQVRKIERLINGPRFSGPAIEIHRDGNLTGYIETASNRETTKYTWKDIEAGLPTIVDDYQIIKDDMIVATEFLDMGNLPITKPEGEVKDTKKYRWYVENKSNSDTANTNS